MRSADDLVRWAGPGRALGPAVVPTLPTLPTSKMARPCNCEIRCQYMSTESVTQYLGCVTQDLGVSEDPEVSKTLPFLQLWMAPSEIRADRCRHFFRVTSKLPAYLVAIL
jgi:hypothetical protein